MSGIKKHRRFIIIFSLIVLIVIIAIVAERKIWYHELSMQLEDQNGDDTTPCLITDEIIFKYSEEYRAIRHRQISTKSDVSGVKGYHKDHDNDYRKTQIYRLSGILINNAYLGSGSTVTYKIISTVYQGNFRIVVTNANNQILHDIPINQEATVSFFAEENSLYYLKFIGEGAEIETEIWRTTETS